MYNIKPFCVWSTHSIPAALSSLLFCNAASLLASSSCFSLALRLAFFPCVFANLALASDSISSSEILSRKGINSDLFSGFFFAAETKQFLQIFMPE